jgi:hypothetical protein
MMFFRKKYLPKKLNKKASPKFEHTNSTKGAGDKTSVLTRKPKKLM